MDIEKLSKEFKDFLHNSKDYAYQSSLVLNVIDTPDSCVIAAHICSGLQSVKGFYCLVI